MSDGWSAAHRHRESVLATGGAVGDSSARPVIRASWERLLRLGLDPGPDPQVPPLAVADLERRREASRLGPLMPYLREALRPVVDDGLLMVVTDRDGRVLWREGTPGVRRLADSLGFVRGSAWTEGNVGTNAIGTSLVVGEPVRIQGPEHYVESHTRWGCAAAPVRDPWTGRTLGVVDLSGPARAMDSGALGMVRLAARVAELEVRQKHQTELEALRALAAPVVARVGGRAMVVDRHGHLAASTGVTAPARVPLPEDMSVGEVWLPSVGPARAEPLPGGWLLRLEDPHAQSATPAVTLTLDLARQPASLSVVGGSAPWTHEPTPRHTEILLSLALHPVGRSAAELAQDLFADAARVVTVRAEMSRLRRILGPLLLRQPYRFPATARVSVVLPEAGVVLPGSSAPVVAALRRRPE